VTEIRLDFSYPHRPERVWAALTQRQLLIAWLMENDFEAVPGHRFVLWPQGLPGLDGPITAAVLDLTAPRRLRLGWRNGTGQATITVDLRPTRRGSRLRLTYSGDLGSADDPTRSALAATLGTLFGQRLPVVLDGPGASSVVLDGLGPSSVVWAGVGSSAESASLRAAQPAESASVTVPPEPVAVSGLPEAPPVSPGPTPEPSPAGSRSKDRARIRVFAAGLVIVPAVIVAGLILLPDRWTPGGGGDGSGSGRLGGAPRNVVEFASAGPTRTPGPGEPSAGTTAGPGAPPSAGPTATPSVTASATPVKGSLKISYTVTPIAAASLNAVEVDVQNVGELMIEGWTVAFSFSGVNLAVIDLKGATHSRRGPLHVFEPDAETFTVQPNETVGFSFSLTGALSKITSCTVDGEPC